MMLSSLFYIISMLCVFKKHGENTKFTILCDMNDGNDIKCADIMHIHAQSITIYPISQK